MDVAITTLEENAPSGCNQMFLCQLHSQQEPSGCDLTARTSCAAACHGLGEGGPNLW